MVHQHMKSRLASLTFSEMQIKPTLRVHLTSEGMTIIKNSNLCYFKYLNVKGMANNKAYLRII